MATRFYFAPQTAAPISPPAPAAEWEHSNLRINRYLKRAPGIEAPLNGDVVYDAADHIADQDALVCQFVSDELSAQTVLNTGTVTLVIRGSEQRATNNLFLTWKVYKLTTGGAASTSLVPIRRDNTEFTNTLLSRTDAVAPVQVTFSAGERICVELGLGGLPQTGTSIDGHNGSLRFVDDVVSDLTAADGLTSDNRPWIEFSQTLTFVPPPLPPTHITQDALELLYSDPVAPTHLTQDALELLLADLVKRTHVTQDALEVLYNEIPTVTPMTFLTQDALEILWSPPEPPPPPTEEDIELPDGQITTARAVAGDIIGLRVAEGQIATSRSAKGQIGLG